MEEWQRRVWTKYSSVYLRDVSRFTLVAEGALV